MKVNASHVFVDLDGNPLLEAQENGPPKPITLSVVAVRALYAPLEGDRNAPFEQQAAREDLAVRFHKGGEVELTPEEATLLRSRIERAGFGPRVAVPAYRMLG